MNMPEKSIKREDTAVLPWNNVGLNRMALQQKDIPERNSLGEKSWKA